jgi:hypothetical protein
MSLRHSRSISVAGSFLDARILMKMKGYPYSNLDRRSMNGWSGACLLPPVQLGRDRAPGRHGCRLARAQAHPMGHQTPFWFFLRDLCYERNLFCPLIAAETDHKRWSTGRWLERCLAAVRSFSGDALASRTSPTSSLWNPLACRPVQWLQSVMNSSNLVAARVQRVSSFVGKNQSYVLRYL